MKTWENKGSHIRNHRGLIKPNVTDLRVLWGFHVKQLNFIGEGKINSCGIKKITEILKYTGFPLFYIRTDRCPSVTPSN